MNVSINRSTASPTEYLQWLQLRAAREPSAFGSWMSLSANEVVRDRSALEASLEKLSGHLLDNVVNGEGSGLDDWERAILESRKALLDSHISTGSANVAYHSLLRDLVKDVERAAASLGYEVSEKVTFGILPTGSVNGLACQVPAGGLIVAIDDGLFNFLYSLAKAVAQFYTFTPAPNGPGFSLVETNIGRAVRTNEEANRRFLEILVATFVYGYPNRAPIRPLLDNRSVMLDALVTPVELFIVAHEYGHLISGHLARPRATLKRTLSGGVTVDGFDTAKQEELEADRIGLELLREHHRSMGISVDDTRLGIWFWAGCLNIIQEMLGEGPTHPPAAIRSKQLLQLLAREEGIDEAASTPSEVVYQLMAALRFHNWNRYEEWKQRARNGELPWG